MQARLICFLGLFVFILLAWLVSSHRRRFPWRVVIGGLLLQFTLAFLVLQTTPGQQLFDAIGAGFNAVMDTVGPGREFVFLPNGQQPDQAPILQTFAFRVLPTVIFFSSLMSILYYLGVMQRLVWAMAWVM